MSLNALLRCVKPPKLVYADGKTSIRNSWLFSIYLYSHENRITDVAAKTHPFLGERLILHVNKFIQIHTKLTQANKNAEQSLQVF